MNDADKPIEASGTDLWDRAADAAWSLRFDLPVPPIVPGQTAVDTATP